MLNLNICLLMTAQKDKTINVFERIGKERRTRKVCFFFSKKFLVKKLLCMQD